MITYLYWTVVIVVIALVLFVAGIKFEKWKAGLIIAAIVFTVGWLAFIFHFQQVFVKRYGGVMTISVPKGQEHIALTWKGDNLWVENYDPATNRCIFSEYSKGSLLEGKVIIKNCKPLRAIAK